MGLMANICLKSCFTTIGILVVTLLGIHVANCQSLCLDGLYYGTLVNGSKGCLPCLENCGFGFEKMEDCTEESDIKCRKCSNGTFYDGQDMTCKTCTECTVVIMNCTFSTDAVCGNNTVQDTDDGTEGISLRIVLIAACAIAVGIFVITIVALLCFCMHRKKGKDTIRKEPAADKCEEDELL